MNNTLRLGLGSDKVVTVTFTDENGQREKIEFPSRDVLDGKKEEEKVGLLFFVEEYINSKDNNFRLKLFKKYKEANDQLDELILDNTLEPINIKMFHDILDLINIKDLTSFLSTIVPVPKELQDKFVPDKDETLNEIQTYTKKQYLELIVLATLLKFTLPVLGKYMHIKSHLVNKHLKVFFFLPIYESYSKIRELDSYEKLYLFAEKAFIKENTAENAAVRTMLFNIPKDETVRWLFSAAIISGIMALSSINDTAEENIIKRLFNNILKNKINKTTENTKIKSKAETVSKGDENSQESMSESCRVTTKLSPGYVEEIDWATETPDFIAKQLKNKNFVMDKDLANECFNFMMSYAKEGPFIVSDAVFTLLGWIFHSPLLHADAFERLGMKSLYSTIAVAYSHLAVNGFKDIGLMVYSKLNTIDSGSFNNSTNKAKIPDIIKEELEASYSIIKKRKLTKTKIEEVSICEVAIGMLSDMMYAEEYITFAKKEDILDVKGDSSSPLIVAGSELKIRLAELLIFINKR